MIYLIVIVLGLTLGSFVNAMVGRLNAGQNFVSERSVCDSCGHVLGWKDLVPLVSWLSLGGKCRYCSKPISIQNPLAELVMAGLFALSVYRWDFTAELAYVALGLWLAVVTCMVAIALYDIRYYQVPMFIAYLMLLLGFALFGVDVFATEEAITDATLRLVWQLLAAVSLIVLPYAVSRGKWMGSGDIYLAALSGLVMSSIIASFAGVLVGFYLGALFTLPLMALGKVSRKSKIPFGPFILSGVYGWFLWQVPLMRLIEQFLGL